MHDVHLFRKRNLSRSFEEIWYNIEFGTESYGETGHLFYGSVAQFIRSRDHQVVRIYRKFSQFFDSNGYHVLDALVFEIMETLGYKLLRSQFLGFYGGRGVFFRLYEPFRDHPHHEPVIKRK